MKKIIVASLVILVFIFSCNTGKNNNLILQKPGNIKADEYVINIDKDTVLVTKNGALLKIPKGSLATQSGNSVILEIKEAYSMEQMIRACLTTQSNGELLSSGGMIYINAKGGQNVTIKQAIKVAIPSDYLSPDMQLFKGENDKEGNINWVNPSALPENKQLTAIEEGMRLFQSQCASCHSIGKDMTGPNLAHFMKRFPNDSEGSERYYEHAYWNYREIDSYLSTEMDSKKDTVIKKNQSKFFKEDFYRHYDPYFNYKCNLIRMFGTMAPLIRTDTSNKRELSKIYRYIQNESDRLNLPLPRHAYLFDCADSCAMYYNQKEKLEIEKNDLKNKKQELISDNGEMVIEKNIPAIPPTLNQNPPPVNFEEMVLPKDFGAEYYQFTIETFGWYNIDVLMKGTDGVEESELFVRIIGEYREKVQVYLIIPSRKVYVQGGPAERNNEEFAFLYKNGKIFLPQNENAYIMAVTERESSIAFALKAFTTSTKQEFEISLQQSTKEKFTTTLNSLSIKDMKIKVDDAKNADEIRKTNKDLKSIEEQLKKVDNLKPKNCNCECGFEGDPETNSAVIIVKNK